MPYASTVETADLSDRWEPLGSVVRSQMTRLGLDQNELARRAEVSRPVITDLRRGTAKRYRPETLLRVSRGLELHPFALIAVLAGDEVVGQLGLPDVAATTVASGADPVREVA